MSQQELVVPAPSDIFYPGQLLPAVVIAVHSQASKQHVSGNGRDELWRASQRIELSTVPSLMNGSVSPASIKDGAVRLLKNWCIL
jgi:hypothetical protein